ncbi:PQQ-binding-like beta-propeller repeat protein, partial [Thermodesulfobacteriota bacterium]
SLALDSRDNPHISYLSDVPEYALKYATNYGTDLAWRSSLGSAVKSSPAVSEGRVFVGSDDGYVYCLNDETGTEQWKFKTSGSGRSSPALSGGRVYIGSDNGSVYCLDAVTGALLWDNETGGDVAVSSPAVSGTDVCVGSNDNALYCFNALTGNKAWDDSSMGGAVRTPVVAGGKVYAGSADGRLYCIDPANGANNWDYQIGVGDALYSPAVTDDTIYVCSYGHADGFDWVGGYVHGVDLSGSEQWSSSMDGRIESAPSVNDGKVYAGGESKNSGIYSFSGGLAGGSELWKYSIGQNGVTSSAAVTGDYMYAGSEDSHCYCLDITSTPGKPGWFYRTGGRIESSPAVSGGKVYVGSNDGYLYCLDADDFSGAWPMFKHNAARTGTPCTDDRDCDGIADSSDNCPDYYNPNQWNHDGGEEGDFCDPDDYPSAAAYPAGDPAGSTLTVSSLAGSADITVANRGGRYMRWQAEVLSSPAWVNIDQTGTTCGSGGSDNGTITVQWDAQAQSADARSATIQVTVLDDWDKDPDPLTIQIYQEEYRDNATITINYSPSELAKFQRLSVFGEVRSAVDNATISSGFVRVVFTEPDDSEQRETYELTDDDNGTYEVDFVLTDNGTWDVQAFFLGNDDFLTAESEVVNLEVNPEAPMPKAKAIVVAGGGDYPTNSLWDETRFSANNACRVLSFQGFDTGSLRYYTWQTIGFPPGVDAFRSGDPTGSNIQDAITTWADDGQTNELVIYLVGHGFDGKFELSGGQPPEYLRAKDHLKIWLDQLQQAVPDMLVVLVYDACHSGSIVEDLYTDPGTDPERIIITSTTAGQVAYFLVNGMVSFSSYFWSSVQSGHYLWDAWSNADDAMYTHGQEAQIEYDGDGNPGNYYDDALLAESYLIGKGISIAGNMPVIGSVSNPQTLSGGGTSATIEAYAIEPEGSIQEVWMVLQPPSASSGTYATPVEELPRVTLWDNDTDGVFAGTYDSFSIGGRYWISLYARDTDNNTSMPQKTYVTQASGPDLYEDDDSAVQANVINMGYDQYQEHNIHDSGDTDWVKFYGLAGETYSIEVADVDAGLAVFDPVFEVLDANLTLDYTRNRRGKGSGEMFDWDCTRNGFYYVRVYDYSGVYGAGTNYSLRVYQPVASGGIATVAGFISDSTTGLPIQDAWMTSSMGTAVSTVDGFYFLLVSSTGGSLTLTPVSYGYTGVPGTVILSGAPSYTKNFSMTPGGGYVETSTSTTSTQPPR